jgi:hypothetical protein
MGRNGKYGRAGGGGGVGFYFIYFQHTYLVQETNRFSVTKTQEIMLEMQNFLDFFLSIAIGSRSCVHKHISCVYDQWSTYVAYRLQGCTRIPNWSVGQNDMSDNLPWANSSLLSSLPVAIPFQTPWSIAEHRLQSFDCHKCYVYFFLYSTYWVVHFVGGYAIHVANNWYTSRSVLCHAHVLLDYIYWGALTGMLTN